MAAGLALALGGCSGTPFGDRLAGSFSAPIAQPAAPTPTAGGQAPASTATPSPNPGAGNRPVAPNKTQQTGTPEPPSGSRAQRPGRAAAPLPPAPYRITIKLPTADPSAPAEVVTDALRQAGVPFEVEMIERVNSGSQAIPAPTPAPAPRPR